MTKWTKWSAIATLALFPQVAMAQSDVGRFVVTEVVINPALDSRQSRFYDSDPRYVGREVDITNDRAAIDGGGICERAHRTTKRGTLASLLSHGLPAGSSNAKRLAQLPKVGLPSANRSIDLTAYQCVGSSGDWSSTTGFQIDARKRGLVISDEILLILTPASALPPPKPSFSCGPGNNAAESAICHDPRLARWDLSVQKAYHWARYGSTPNLLTGLDQLGPRQDGDVEGDQRRWLSHRNQCGSDKACLAKAMSDRMSELIS